MLAMWRRYAYREAVRKFVIAALLWLALDAAGVTTPALATQLLHGRIVEIRASGRVLVSHEAYAGMPAMSMPFRVAPRTLSKLHRGMEITAVVDERTTPATLSAVRVVAIEAPAARYVPELQEGDTLPDFALVDQNERAISFSRFRGQALVLSFIYTRCRDVTMCSLVSAKFSRLQRRLGRQSIHLMEVTLDPAYDTPHVLARYGTAFGANAARWTLATGELTALSDLAARAGIATTETPSGIIHSEAVIVLDPRGQIWKIVAGNQWTVDDIYLQARASLGHDPGPVARVWLALQSGVAAVCGGRSALSTGAALSIFVAVLIAATLLLRRFLRASIPRT